MKVRFNLFTHFINKTFSCVIANYYSQSKVLFNKTDVNLKNWQEELDRTMQVVPNFITTEEEKFLIEEIDPYMKRLRYEQSHWDDVSISESLFFYNNYTFLINYYRQYIIIEKQRKISGMRET